MKNVYFIGIGGIGMSAIARYYNHAGYKVSGYDRTPSRLTAELEREGIEIHYTEDTGYIPAEREETLVIYTPAIPKEMKELRYVIDNGYKVVKRSRALGEIASHNRCIAVAGTHGKTTTGTMIAHLFTACGKGCNAFLGGISKNYHTNLLLSKNNLLVAEADEFDRSFLQLFPDIAIITSVDADHLDIYGNIDSVKEAFSEFASQIKRDGLLILKKGVEIDLSRVKAKVARYSYNNPCDYSASNIKVVDGGYIYFDINYPGGVIENCTVGVPGWVNVENAVAAAAAALNGGISAEELRAGLATFAGAERRFDIHVNTPRMAYIDDYAHHPNEISSAISSIRNIFPGRKLCGIFQPHLYTRTRDFAPEFAKSLGMLDELLLLDIYPARELPIEGVTSDLIFKDVDIENKRKITKEELMPLLEREMSEGKIDILITFGAGDIDRFICKITDLMKNILSR